VDLNPKTKQPFWETPRNIVILLAAASAIAGWAGFTWGSDLASRPPPQVVINFLPAAVPAAPAN